MTGIFSQAPIRQRLALWLGDNIRKIALQLPWVCLLYTSDAADERSSVDLGGRRIIKKKKHEHRGCGRMS